jgi:hypothetical protein
MGGPDAPVRHSRSDMRASANSIANTATSLANRPCGLFGFFALHELRRWSRSERLPAEWSANKELCGCCRDTTFTRHPHRLRSWNAGQPIQRE